ncbi:hypothetical protein VCR15J2_390082 [Vibrio coralliirubri]|uniref:hypothetical protein n=1 Tax=Vibrio coralliirubri TaxID=1516159 RepID=UPI0006388ADA|nr:hypothetical protein [Vibrio coralliirubri]CDT53515.1 hypothetical protein VCR15J2_390082 [Vibrio coralliirubri]
MTEIFTYRSEHYKSAKEAHESGAIYLIQGVDSEEGWSSYHAIDHLLMVEHGAYTLGQEIGIGYIDNNRLLDLTDGKPRDVAWAGFESPTELFEHPELQEFIYHIPNSEEKQ